MKINDKYSIKCKLHKGQYKYILYETNTRDGVIASMVDKHSPDKLPKRGQILHLMKHMKYDSNNVKEFKKQKEKDLNCVINKLKVSLDENELVFGEYQQTNKKIYTKKGTEVFYFAMLSAEYLQDEKYRIEIESYSTHFIIEGRMNYIFNELICADLVNFHVGNYRFIFRALMEHIMEKSDKELEVIIKKEED